MADFRDQRSQLKETLDSPGYNPLPVPSPALLMADIRDQRSQLKETLDSPGYNPSLFHHRHKWLFRRHG